MGKISLITRKEYSRLWKALEAEHGLEIFRGLNMDYPTKATLFYHYKSTHHVGLLACRREDSEEERVLRVDLIWVYPQGGGHGKKFLALIRDEALKYGDTSLPLTVKLDSVKPAKDFYREQGFRTRHPLTSSSAIPSGCHPMAKHISVCTECSGRLRPGRNGHGGCWVCKAKDTTGVTCVDDPNHQWCGKHAP